MDLIFAPSLEPSNGVNNDGRPSESLLIAESEAAMEAAVAAVAASAAQANEWHGAGQAVGLQIWRIEQFSVVPWPRIKYGHFHEGDSYIVLNTYQPNAALNPDKLAWDLHFWIGSSSSADEYGCAAYKSQELDTHLGGDPVQWRETEGMESDRFTSYFPDGLTILMGGAPSGFTTVVKQERASALFRVKGRGNRMSLKQLPLSRSQLGSDDVFILEAPQGVYQWNGKKSNAFERQKASWFCARLHDARAADGESALASLMDPRPARTPGTQGPRHAGPALTSFSYPSTSFTDPMTAMRVRQASPLYRRLSSAKAATTPRPPRRRFGKRCRVSGAWLCSLSWSSVTAMWRGHRCSWCALRLAAAAARARMR